MERSSTQRIHIDFVLNFQTIFLVGLDTCLSTILRKFFFSFKKKLSWDGPISRGSRFVNNVTQYIFLSTINFLDRLLYIIFRHEYIVSIVEKIREVNTSFFREVTNQLIFVQFVDDDEESCKTGPY